MELANDIVNLAFGLALVGLTIALALGSGGWTIATTELRILVDSMILKKNL